MRVIMKYKKGDTVKIKSLDWYNKNKDEYGYYDAVLLFSPSMSKYCGKIATITDVLKNCYRLDIDVEDPWLWTDEMLEEPDTVLVGKNYKLSYEVRSLDELETLANKHKCVAWKHGLGKSSYTIKPAAFFIHWPYIQLKYAINSLFTVEKLEKVIKENKQIDYGI